MYIRKLYKYSEVGFRTKSAIYLGMLHCFSQGLKILKRRGSNKVKKKLLKILIQEHWMYHIN